MHLVGLDIGFAESRRSNAMAIYRDGELTTLKLNIAERNAALAGLNGVDVIAIDAPVLPFDTPLETIREVERIFCRGAFQKRCKPGFSHVKGTGHDLRAHGLAAARASMHATHAPDDHRFPRVIPGHNIVEAFPNAFLGVALTDDEYAAQPQLPRGGKFDWLYDRWVATSRFHEAVRLAGLPDSVAAAADAERDHELRAAIVCLLTAAFAHAGTAEAVGDPIGGYFFLPPKPLWASWARDAADTPNASQQRTSARSSRTNSRIGALSNKTDILARVAAALLSNDIAAAEEAARHYPFEPKENACRRYSERDMLRVFMRDGFVDRYSGERLVLPGALRLISKLLPHHFPFHPNWKMSECHIAYWELMPTLDHVIPIARGGADDESNWVTTSMLLNAAKSNWTLKELKWQLHPRGDLSVWDGLTSWFREFVGAHPEHANDPYIRKWTLALSEHADG